MERNVRDVPEMYSEMMRLLDMQGDIEQSRNGPVLTLPEPLLITVHQPWNRVLNDPIRCANPFFHVMEFVWMMAGSNDVKWISQFNSRFKEYADADGTVHGAYGYRWANYFKVDQLRQVVDLLKRDPESRRAVLGMWDPQHDLGTEHNDLPCNTHIYFRRINGRLDMTVCNRSNDAVWGMTGANAVHMTLLHELVATLSGMGQGKYRVFTNNAHLYFEVPGMQDCLKTTYTANMSGIPHLPLLQPGESLEDIQQDCRQLMLGRIPSTEWMYGVALPMRDIYLRHIDNVSVDDINCPQWQKACVHWLQWKR